MHALILPASLVPLVLAAADGMAQDAPADLALSALFLIALVATVLFYHAPRRVAHLADYFTPLGLGCGRRGLFGWLMDGMYRNVALKIECGSTVRGSGPFALVATVRFSEALKVLPETLLPPHTTVFSAGPEHLCFRLPEELYEKNSALEPIGLINRLVELDPQVDGAPAAMGSPVYTHGPLHPWNLVISVLAAGGAMACAAWVSFFAAAGVLALALIAAVYVSNRRQREASDLATRAWAVQTALVMALGILGCGLCYTRFGLLSLRDFEPHPVGMVVEIPHEHIHLAVTRQLERGQGQLGPGGKVLGNSLQWRVTDQQGRTLESGELTLPLQEFDWVAPNWDDGQKHFVLGIVHEPYGYKALALLPVFADGQGPPPTPSPTEPAHIGADGWTVYRYWVLARIDVPPGSPLFSIMQERARRDEKARQRAAAGEKARAQGGDAGLTGLPNSPSPVAPPPPHP